MDEFGVDFIVKYPYSFKVSNPREYNSLLNLYKLEGFIFLVNKKPRVFFSFAEFYFLQVIMAPKEKRDLAWVHCQLIDGKMVCNYCQKEVGGSSSKRARGNLESFFVPRTTLGAQPTIDAKWKMERKAAWECIARWWYDADIPFNAAKSVYYQPMLDAIAACGMGFKGLGYGILGGHF